jgi:hypothetical protein
MKPPLLFLILLVLSLEGTHKLAAQGPLIPPGPPAPAYKTLQQVEPRIPIASLPYTINQPGSYYLTTNLTGVASQPGITITSDNVTIDLNDHALVGVAQALDGLRVEGTRTNITIRNGSLQNWPGDGVDASSAVNSQLRNLVAARNAGAGLRAGEGSVVIACSARTNTLDGIVASSGCRVTDCTTSRNGSEGLTIGTGGSIEG